jgi:drug/metabolite transporter (DMT)-like permease
VTVVSVVVMLYPALAVGGGWLVLGEAMTWQQVVGMVLSIVGVTLVLGAR